MTTAAPKPGPAGDVFTLEDARRAVEQLEAANAPRDPSGDYVLFVTHEDVRRMVDLMTGADAPTVCVLDPFPGQQSPEAGQGG